MVLHGSTYIVPQGRSFRGTLYFFGQVDSIPRGLAVTENIKLTDSVTGTEKILFNTSSDMFNTLDQV